MAGKRVRIVTLALTLGWMASAVPGASTLAQVRLQRSTALLCGAVPGLGDARCLTVRSLGHNSPPQIITGSVAFGKQVIGTGLVETHAVVAVDFTGDGELDVVATDFVGDRVPWFENNGNGEFTERLVAGNLNGAYPVSVGDVNLDGHVDVLVGAYRADVFAWFENDGVGNFTFRDVDGSINGPHSIVPVDMDSDGDIDLVTTAQIAGHVGWYENTGGENFALRVIDDDAEAAKRAEPVDLDGDGDLDVISASFDNDRIAWHENRGGEDFITRVIDTTADGAYYVFPADLDNDFDVDILAVSQLNDTVAWYENNGSESFTARTIDSAADAPRTVIAVDIDRDGDLDPLVASVDDDTVAWYRNDGNGSFAKQIIDGAADGAYGVFAIDMDFDGDLDVLSASRDSAEIALHSQFQAHQAAVEIGGTLVFDATLLRAVDAEDADAALIYTITDAPDFGQLRVSGQQLESGSRFSQEDINLGRLAYIHGGLAANDRFTFTVTDGGAGVRPAVGHFTLSTGEPGNPIVQLPLDDGAGTVALNVAGSGNNGILVNGPAFEANTADGSPFSVRFDGVDDFIDLGTLDLQGSGLTLATWFNADTFPGSSRDPRLISKATDTDSDSHVFMLGTIKVGSATRLRTRVRVNGSTTTLIAGSGDLSPGEWRHAAATHDLGTLRLYLDGVEVGSTPLAGTVDIDPVTRVAVGGQPPGAGSRFFDGLIDDVRILDSPLSAQQIADIFEGTQPSCGDGVLDPGEACDDGNNVSGDGCQADCAEPACGDGVLDADEDCDDGNTISGDGCQADCSDPACGDGIVDPDEQCDDGNNASGDGCQADCSHPACGDGILDPGEQCDDGNTTSGDGCQADCNNPACGDGILDPGEQCDDGNTTSGDGCQANCNHPACGDAVVDPGEQCDDGNQVSGDGCQANCVLPECGDGILDPGEECDDGNLAPGDGCDEQCRTSSCGNGVVDSDEQCDDGLANSDTIPDACRTDCTSPACGDGTLDSGEECDDANLTDGDNCSAICDLENPCLELGSVEVTHRWTRVTFPEGCTNPVVIAGVPTFHGEDPGTIRVRRVDASSFEVAFDEWQLVEGAPNTGAHNLAEQVSYLIIDAGRHELADGSVWEAGLVELDGSRTFHDLSFTEAWPAAPGLLLTLQTSRNSEPATLRARNVTGSGFEAAMFEELALDTGRGLERLGYLAISSPQRSGFIDIYDETLPYVLQQASIDERFTPVLSWSIRLQEDRSVNLLDEHADETLSILVLGSHLFAQDISSLEPDTATPRRIDADRQAPIEWGTLRGITHRWLTVPLQRRFEDPVVISKPCSFNGTDPGVVRLRDVSKDSFAIRFQEWQYLNVAHGEETCFYMVAERGRGTIGGLSFEAGSLTTRKTKPRGGFATVNFETAFNSAPAVLSSVQTYAGADPVTTRMRNTTTTGFELTMQEEEENPRPGHTVENLGWIALETGVGELPSGHAIEVMMGAASSTPGRVPFGRRFLGRFPSVVSDIATTNGGDPVVARYLELNQTGIDLFLQEEQSPAPTKDGETVHHREAISMFIASYAASRSAPASPPAPASDEPAPNF